MMRDEIPVLNHFMFVLSEMKQHTPQSYIAELYARLNAIGYNFEIPQPSVLSLPYGDIYILLDRWGDALNPSVNELERKYGEKYFINLAWSDGGQEILAHVLTEREVDLDSSGLDY